MYRQLLNTIAAFAGDILAGVPEELLETRYGIHPARETPLEWISDRIAALVAVGYGPALTQLIEANRGLMQEAAPLSGFDSALAQRLAERIPRVATETVAALEVLLGEEPTTNSVHLIVTRQEARVLRALANATHERTLQLTHKEMPLDEARANGVLMMQLVDRIDRAMS